MFKAFCKFFDVQEINTSIESLTNSFKDNLKNVYGFSEIFNLFEGKSFGNGLYRLHTIKNIEKWNSIILQAYPEFKGRIECFGYDWLGRQFAIHNGRIEDGQPQILMFEPGTSEVLEIPCNFLDFHENEIPNYHDACLASDFYNSWLYENPKGLTPRECVGYKVHLFLGGEDVISNLEKSDMEVYWSISAQIIRRTKELPTGSVIKNFNIL